MGEGADFMAGHLVRATTPMLGLGGGETLGGFQFRARAAGARGPGGEFLFVMLEVIVHALQFAAQVGRLPVADGRQIRGQIRSQRGLEKFPPARRCGGRPGIPRVRVRGDVREVEGLGEGIVCGTVR